MESIDDVISARSLSLSLSHRRILLYAITYETKNTNNFSAVRDTDKTNFFLKKSYDQ